MCVCIYIYVCNISYYHPTRYTDHKPFPERFSPFGCGTNRCISSVGAITEEFCSPLSFSTPSERDRPTALTLVDNESSFKGALNQSVYDSLKSLLQTTLALLGYFVRVSPGYLSLGTSLRSVAPGTTVKQRMDYTARFVIHMPYWAILGLR